jgi:hypothetical protein
MTTARGIVAGVVRAEQHIESIDVSSGSPVIPASRPPLEFPRPLGAPPVRLGSYLERESEARGHLLQLVIDAASVSEEKRPRGLSDHIARLWRAVEQLLFTDSSSHHRRLIDPEGTEACHRTAEKFLMLMDRPESEWAAPGILRDSVAGIFITRIDVTLAGDGPHFAENARRVLERMHEDLLFLAPTYRGKIIPTTVAGRILGEIRDLVGDDGPRFALNARRVLVVIRDRLIATGRRRAEELSGQ